MRAIQALIGLVVLGGFSGCGPEGPPDGEFCGGIAGIPCPDGSSCVDDPSDDCDPRTGGADCGGICVPGTNPCAAALCPVQTECVVRDGEAVCVPIGGEPCGERTCGAGMVCCNASCGICTPPGGACIQVACD
jgi:hypothetical protein